MYGIGQFAQFAKVSVRTLRHYDDVGLLRPAHVDGGTGYRHYEASQLASLNRILALKDLGFSLAEITRLFEAGVSNDELLGMLRLRQAEAERSAIEVQQQLSRVAARISLLQGDETMTEANVVVKALDPARVAMVSTPVEGFDEDFSPFFGPMYERLFGALGRIGVAPVGPAWALYDERADGRIDLIAAAPIAADSEIDDPDLVVRDLPAAERAATLVHEGDMPSIRSSYAALDQWMQAAGETPDGFSREIYLDCPEDQADWITELQFVLK